MEIKLSDVADLVGGSIYGDDSVFIENIAKIEEAQKGDLTFLYHPLYEKYFETTQASAILVKPGFNKTRSDISYIEVPNPNQAFLKVVEQYFKPEYNLNGIDQTAYVHKTAIIGQNVALGKNVVISAGCRVGDNTKIFHNTVLLEESHVGSDCLIFQNVSIREKCSIGSRVIIHPGSCIGSDGFGYMPGPDGKYIKIPQVGNVVVEDDVEIGSNVSIDRASIGSTIIKKGVKIDNLVQIAHNVVIGENTAISAQTGVSGSTRVGKNCIFAGQVGIVGHVEIADNVIIAAQSGVSKGLAKAGTYFGSPAKEHRVALKLEAMVRNLPQFAEKIRSLENTINELQETLKKMNEKGDK